MELRNFKALNNLADTSDYVAMLEAFDAIPQLRELKEIARQRGGIANGKSVLDIGCGFGLETVRLAQLVGPEGHVNGLDKSDAFIAEARRRAEAVSCRVTYQSGDATNLSFEDASFDCVRAERLLIYLKDFQSVLAEMRRVLRPGGHLALIEPDFSTITINVADRELLRKVIDYEIAHAVEQSWLPGPLNSALEQLGFQNIKCDSRALIFQQDLGATYFKSLGVHAEEAGAITDTENQEWQRSIDRLRETGQIFATVAYFLFTASHP
ncbi:methyltransferase domain-containing protein [Roseibium sp. SCPC15]|uniref:methyltransferase domain-containing protein n=1 Tax=Roseibium sp. SCP15 TaxID=3141376 RepID=UPI003335CB7A